MYDGLKVTDEVLAQGISAIARGRSDLGEATADAEHVAGFVGHGRLESTLHSFAGRWRITRTRLTDSMSKLEANLSNIDIGLTNSDVLQQSDGKRTTHVDEQHTTPTSNAAYAPGGSSGDSGLTPMSGSAKAGGAAYEPGDGSSSLGQTPSGFSPRPNTPADPIGDPIPGDVGGGGSGGGGGTGDGGNSGDLHREDITPPDSGAPGGSGGGAGGSSGPIGEPLPDSPGLGGGGAGGLGGGGAPIGDSLPSELGALEQTDPSPLDDSPLGVGTADGADSTSEPEAAADDHEGGFNPAFIAAGLASLGLAAGAASLVNGGDEEAVVVADSDRVKGARHAIEELRRNRGGSGDPT